MPKKNHYDVLGVNKTATTDEIKKARKRKARDLHPDKATGDHDAMAELNHAHDILSDPQRRLLYDQTGQDSQRPIDEEIKNEILAAFADALNREAADCLRHARQVLTSKQNEIKAQRSAAQAAQKKLIARRAKISVKRGDNLLHLLIDQQLERIAAGIATCDRGRKVMAGALKLLDDYESSEEPVKEATRMIVFGSTSAPTGFF
jgi:curved DNA-binding protein CbpA